MSVTFHSPSAVKVTGVPDEEVRRRVESALLQAVARAVVTAAADIPEGILATARAEHSDERGQRRGAMAPKQAATNFEDRREVAHSAEAAAAEDTRRASRSALPSEPAAQRLDVSRPAAPRYEDTGEEIEVPGQPQELAAEYDRVDSGPSPVQGRLLVHLPGNQNVFVQSERYAVATNLTRAVQWGLALFGIGSFAILQGPIGDPTSSYMVVGASRSVTEADLGSMVRFEGQVGRRLAGFTADALWNRKLTDEHGKQYALRAIYTPTGRPLFPPQVEFAETYLREVQATPLERKLTAEVARPLIFGAIDDLIYLIDKGETGRVQEAAGRLAKLNAYAFAAVDWRTKERYLEILLDAWTSDEEETAVVEIVKSLDNPAQLHAAMETLKRRKRYEKIFDDLDSQLWSLLITIGKRFGKREPFSVGLLLRLLQDAGLVPRSWTELVMTSLPGISPPRYLLSPHLVTELKEAVFALRRFGTSTAASVKMLVTEPDKVLEGIGQLLRLTATVQLALQGHREALETLGSMLSHLSTELLYAVEGAAILGAGERIAIRLKWTIVVEAASWLVGPGEIRAMAGGAGAGEALASVARFLHLVGRTGEVAEADVVAGRLSRLSRAISEASATIAHEREALELLSRLPEEDVARLGRLLRRFDVAEAQGLKELARTSPELQLAAEEALVKAEALKALAARAGGLSEEVVSAFGRLAGRDGFHPEELTAIVRAIPEAEGARFLTMLDPIGLQRVGPRREVRADFLKTFAASTTRMDALHAFGYEASRSVYNRARDGAVLDRRLATLTERGAKFQTEGRAVEFQDFLEKIAAGEREAVVALEGTELAALLDPLQEMIADNPQAQAGLDRLLRQGHDELFAYFARESAPDADKHRTIATLERLAQLTDRQVDGFAAVMRADRMLEEIILTLEAGFRDPLLELVGDLAGSVYGGLELAIRRGLAGSHNDIQGTLGHLFAARTLQERFPGARFRFEVPALGREIDIEMRHGGRLVDVEVKTNLALEPSITRSQIRKDLLRHAADRWRDMLYLYSPQQAAALPKVEQAMRSILARIDRADRIDELPSRLGMPLADALKEIEDRISAPRPNRLVDVYTY